MNTVIRTLLISLLALSTGLHDAHAAGRKKPAHKKAPAAAAAATPEGETKRAATTPEGEAKSESKAVATARAPRVRSFTLDRNRQVVETTPAIARTDAVPAGRKRKEPTVNSATTVRTFTLDENHRVVEKSVVEEQEEKPAKKARSVNVYDGDGKLLEDASIYYEMVEIVIRAIKENGFNDSHEKLLVKILANAPQTIGRIMEPALNSNNVVAVKAICKFKDAHEEIYYQISRYFEYDYFLHTIEMVEVLVANLSNEMVEVLVDDFSVYRSKLFGALFSSGSNFLHALAKKTDADSSKILAFLLDKLHPLERRSLLMRQINGFGFTPLETALDHNNTEKFKILFNYLDPELRREMLSKKDQFGCTLFDKAIGRNNPEIVKEILSKLNLEEKLKLLSNNDHTYFPLLHSMIITCRHEMFRAILDCLTLEDKIAVLSLKSVIHNVNGYTPLHTAVGFASAHANPPVPTADTNAKYNSYKSIIIEILSHLSINAYPDITKTMREKIAACIAIKNSDGHTARELAPELFDKIVQEENELRTKNITEYTNTIATCTPMPAGIDKLIAQHLHPEPIVLPTVEIGAEGDCEEAKEAMNEKPDEKAEKPVNKTIEKNTCFFCHKKMLRGEPQIAFTKCRNRFHKNCLLDYCEKNDVDVNHPFNCPQCGTEVTLPKERDPLAFAKKISADHTTARAMDQTPDEIGAIGESKRAATPAGTDDASTNYAKCFICNNRLLGQDNNIQACGHIFHDDCIHDWHNLLIQDNHALNCPECDALAKNTHETPAPTRLQSPAAPAPTVTNLSSLPAPRAASPIAHVATPAPAGEDAVRTVNIFDGEDTTSTWGQKDMSLGE